MKTWGVVRRCMMIDDQECTLLFDERGRGRKMLSIPGVFFFSFPFVFIQHCTIDRAVSVHMI